MAEMNFFVPEMRLLTAAELLDIRRTVRADAGEDEQERSLLGNAALLAACCRQNGEAVFADGQAVLNRLTAAQMERLLTVFAEKNAAESRAEEPSSAGENPAFDQTRYERLKEGETLGSY